MPVQVNKDGTGVIIVNDFSGGLNDTENKLFIKDNESPNAENIWWYESGLKKRLTRKATRITLAAVGSGSSGVPFRSKATIYSEARLTASAVAITEGRFPFSTTNGTTFTLLAYKTGTVTALAGSTIITGSGTGWVTSARGGTFFRINNISTTIYAVDTINSDTSLTLRTTIGTGATASAYELFHVNEVDTQRAELADKIYFISGDVVSLTSTGRLGYYDGTNTRIVTTGPLGSAGNGGYRTLVSHNGYIFVGNDTSSDGHTSEIRWSDLNDGTKWPINNNLSIDKQSGDGIVSLFSYQGSLLIFKTRSVFLLLGRTFDPSNPTYELIKLNHPPFARIPSVNSPTIRNGAVYFLTSDGFYVYNGGGSTQKVPNTIQNTISSAQIQNDGSDADTGKFARDGILLDRNLLFHSLGDVRTASANPSRQIVLDTNDKYWIWTYGANTLTNDLYCNYFEFVNGSALGNAANGSSMVNILGTALFDTDTTGGNLAVSAYWLSKEFNIGYGHFKYIVLYYKKQSGTLTVDVRVDQGTGITSTANMNVGRGSMVRRTLPIDQVGSTIQVGFSNNNTGENFEIYGFEIPFTLAPENRLL